MVGRDCRARVLVGEVPTGSNPHRSTYSRRTQNAQGGNMKMDYGTYDFELEDGKYQLQIEQDSELITEKELENGIVPKKIVRVSVDKIYGRHNVDCLFNKTYDKLDRMQVSKDLYDSRLEDIDDYVFGELFSEEE